MDEEVRICALCGAFIEEGKGISCRDFGDFEMYFCNEKCRGRYYDMYGHISRSNKFIEDIAPAKSELGGAVRDFLLADTRNLVAGLNDAGFGYATKLVGGIASAINSPEAKARRKARRDAIKQKIEEREEQALQERLQRRRQTLYNFDPNGAFKEVKETTTDALGYFDAFVRGTFSESAVPFYMSTISQIRKVCVTGIESIKAQNAKLGAKMQKKYDIALGYLAVKYEIDCVEQKNGGSITQIQTMQQTLKDNLANAKKALPAYKSESLSKLTALRMKSIIPFTKVTKEEVANAKAERIQKITELKQAVADAKKLMADNMKNLQKEEARLKKEGSKELAALKKMLSRFQNGRPKPEQLEHALAFAKENNV